ncbi:MAG: PEP-CTERM sorting domain-containing protein [Verrucomicrobiales bacterium]|jgi:hypothetical protein|nr:PEP-CTERM sorting domain-containing protein [Verrucomicrobiales bacterium]
MKTSKQIGTWLAMGALLLASGAGALAATWTDGGEGNDWDTAANWQGSTVPADNEAVTFGNLTPSVSIVSVNNNHDDLLVGQITFTGSTAYTISGLVITSTNSNNVVINNSSVRQTISADFYSGAFINNLAINGGAAGLAFGKFINTSTNNWTYTFNNGTTIISQFYITNDTTGNGTNRNGYQMGLTGNGTVVFNEVYDSTDSENTRAFGLGLYNGQNMILTGTSYTKGTIQIRGASTVILRDNADLNVANDFKMDEGQHNSAIINNSSVRLDKLTWNTGTLGGTGSILATRGALAQANNADYRIAPGDINSVGKLSFTDENLVWSNEFSTVTYDWNFNDLTAAAGEGYDQIFVEQGFNLGVNTQYVLNLIGLSGATIDDFADVAPGASWDIISAGSGITNFELTHWTATLPDDVILTLSSDNTKLQLLLIPEPSTWALLGAGAALLAFLRRRR